MQSDRKFAEIDQLTAIVQQAFGTDRRVVESARLPGGSKKGVYRVVLDDNATAVVYIWSAEEDYWHGALPNGSDDPADPFSHSSGLDLFEAATRRLENLGVRSPKLLLADRTRTRYPPFQG